jgi:hypothetical protein
MTRFLLLSDPCGFVDMGRFLWWEDGSVVYNFCWPSPAQSFSGPSSMGLVTIFYCLRFEISLSVASYDPQGYVGGIRPRFYNSGRTEYMSPCLTLPLSFSFIRWHGNVCFASRWLAMDFRVCSLLRERLLPNRCLAMVLFRVCSLVQERVLGEPLVSNGLPFWLHYFGFQASCHNIVVTVQSGSSPHAIYYKVS